MANEYYEKRKRGEVNPQLIEMVKELQEDINEIGEPSPLEIDKYINLLCEHRQNTIAGTILGMHKEIRDIQKEIRDMK